MAYEDSVRGFSLNASPSMELHAAAGIARRDLDDGLGGGVIPRPPIDCTTAKCASPVASLGVTGRLLGPITDLPLLDGCAEHPCTGRDTALISFQIACGSGWTGDFREALLAQARAPRNSAGRICSQGGRLVPHAFDEATAKLWTEWLDGGWVVCLNEFSGYDVVSKDLELERIPALAAAMKGQSGGGDDLVEAMLRFPTDRRPFAPFERPCRAADASSIW